VRARVPARVRVAAAAIVALGALVAMVAMVVRIRADDDGAGRLSFASVRPAAAPVAGFSESRVAVGSRCLRVLVASSPSQRVQGLRGVRSLTPYEGMLFVFPDESTARFTMAGTPTILDITFFSSDGLPVDRARMTPCADGSDARCPEYASRTRYRYALEQPAGSATASGALGACA
jgi:uncharacterized membrane protein (UPF0127 family)